jgi:hypothetical protein
MPGSIGLRSILRYPIMRDCKPMSINPTTQALLDELRAPKHARRDELEAALVTLFCVLSKISQQAAEEQSLAQQAEILEVDPEIQGRMHQYIRKATSTQKHCRDLEKAARDLLTCRRGLEVTDEEIRPVAERAGYKVR